MTGHNDTDKSRILDRLRKLFALSKSSNQHEAELAMQKASEIMQAYQISLTEVDLAAEGNIGKSGDYVVHGSGGARHWVYVLARSAARLYDGECLNDAGQGEMRVVFVGTPVDIEAMKMTFEHLWKSWHSIVESDLAADKQRVELTQGYRFQPRDTMRYKHGHGVGYAQALSERIAMIVKERRAEVQASSATGRALVVVKSAALADWMKRHTSCYKVSGTSSGSNAGRDAGRAAGNSVPLGGIAQRRSHMIGRA